ncbi:MAG TPA: RagB/SusD family nutrient uptake outer membrane protein [Candidatus Phocaeicola gallinarum]|uniref:RagB/SusD family nutrient uptake outer membrane protein n=1 Tax=Phocaeicola faecium TaxID=2762213 RepID=A0ABR8VDH8_9BACT|nr:MULTISPECIES: RagB/SusD family nutrient uptake outer membrane protein [Bacteroidaceae]MBD8002809.1 RagB/SusD family nutrient uptake outer membrane protein [Phocaeicola faecium]MCL1626903.1 RagB/SusD family nutrient uptake outer membrane protein [Bacteroides caecicola]HJC96334.1 RagB/SusD family nutrient uptake outer membrane protein [Candidatus Phocaeicola gallinarum]
MKTKIFKTIGLGALIASVGACDILDVEPLDTYTKEDVFTDVSLLQSYVHRNYNLPQTGWDQSALRFSCDETYNNFNWQSSYTVLEGSVTPDQLGNLDIWSAYYENIKNCNIFFENMDYVNQVDEPERSYLIGEETFFRAFYYMSLVNRYGGVPIITKSYNLEDTDEMMDVKRASYKECVDSIITWFDRAANYLPEQYSDDADFGRATSIAAKAMKSRMLLYAASPLWASESGRTYQEAADAAKEVIDLCLANGMDLDPDYGGMFLNPESQEIIFERLYDQEHGHYFDWDNSPNGYGGYSGTCITQEMVDSYELPGRTFPDRTWYTTGDSTDVNPWQNRDPRFYASVLCDGQEFRGREVAFYVQETENEKTHKIEVVSGGIDSEFGNQNWNYSKSHYTIRKFMDETLRVAWTDKGSQPWIYCRLGEIYLNYAEASYFAGDEETARKYLNLIRQRARNYGVQYLEQDIPDMLPDITASGDELFEAIQQERKVELAFEEHRFFDVRRWKNAEENQVGQFHGIRILKKLNGVKNYKIIELGKVRSFIAPNHYLVPIPNYERRKNSALEQNPGYSDL